MAEKDFQLYRYRWVVLAVFMFINLTIQMLWIAYAPVTGPAAAYYGVSDLQIGLLAMSFMIAFIPLSIPVAWGIDTYGFRITVSIGAVLMGIFGVVRGFAGDNYTLVLLSTIGNLMSSLVPYRIAPGSLKPTKVPAVTTVLIVGSHLLFPTAMAPVFIPAVAAHLSDQAGWLPAGAVNLVLSAALLVLGAALYRATLTPLGRLLQRRENAILDVVTREIE